MDAVETFQPWSPEIAPTFPGASISRSFHFWTVDMMYFWPLDSDMSPSWIVYRHVDGAATESESWKVDWSVTMKCYVTWSVTNVEAGPDVPWTVFGDAQCFFVLIALISFCWMLE